MPRVPKFVLVSRERLLSLLDHVEEARSDDPATRAAHLDMATDEITAITDLLDTPAGCEHDRVTRKGRINNAGVSVVEHRCEDCGRSLSEGER